MTEGDFGLQLLERMNELTLLRHGGTCFKNAEENRQHIKKGESLVQLRKLSKNSAIGSGASAIIIAAGPSVRKQDPASQIRASGYQGAVICTDSATSYCLRSGLIPDLIVSVDPQPSIIRWFGDPELSRSEVEANDYFRRQDLDERFIGKDEIQANDELLELVDLHGKKLRIALSTTTHPQVVQRCLECGAQVYFFNAMHDDPDQEGSITSKLQHENGLPAVNAGGNVGTLCWVMATAVLGKNPVALTGIDLGYYEDTPLQRTQYYDAIRSLVNEEEVGRFFMKIHNPHLDQTFITDPAYHWYRDAFLQMVLDEPSETWNCTEGGILFGKGISFRPLAEFLSKFEAMGEALPERKGAA
ncbi:MAG: 6-hydroxymethylpterin diphosphokinase MptE-like protein [Myxococcota bacterium]